MIGNEQGTSIKTIQCSGNTLFSGNNVGSIDIYDLEKQKKTNSLEKKEDLVKVVPLNINTNVICYCSQEGLVGMDDCRMKNQGQSFRIQQRGLISGMLINGTNNMVYVGTMSGYLLVYDVRCNLISSIF